jgi:colanic acid/amylovoran biosynthesis protein
MARKWLKAQGVSLDRHPTIGLTVLNWEGRTRRKGAQRRYEQALWALIFHLQEKLGAQVAVFAQVTGPSWEEDDRIILKHLRDKFGYRPGLFLVETVPSPEVLMAAYGQLDFLVGTRMHSLIFAAAAGTPFLGISYLEKARGAFRPFNLRDDFIHDIQDLQGDTLVEAFGKAWPQREVLKSLLAHRIQVIREAVRKAGVLIGEDWDRLKAVRQGPGDD